MLSRRASYGLAGAALSLIAITYYTLATDVEIPYLLPSSSIRHQPIAAPDISENRNRHLTESQCLSRYPNLYMEADRAEAWYARKGGITEEMVDKAEQDDGNARLTIVDNIVSGLDIWS